MKVLDVDQSKRMRVVRWPDQHGRTWDLTLDRETLTHTAPPLPRFRAPLLPPIEYVTTDPDRVGRVRIDYAAWEAEWAAADLRWQERKIEVESRDLTPADKATVVGPKPQSAEFVRAARAGNRWVLGLPHPTPGQRYAVPGWARPLLDRLAPAATRPADLTRERQRDARLRYADEDETVDETVDALEPEILAALDDGDDDGMAAEADPGDWTEDDDADLEDDLLDDAPDAGDAGERDEDLDAEPDADEDAEPPIAPTGGAVRAPARPPARRRGRGR